MVNELKIIVGRPGAVENANLLVHFWQRDGGIIKLIVSKPAVADKVNHHIGAKRVTPLSCELAHTHHRLHVVTIDVEHWCTEGFGNVSTVVGGPSSGVACRGCNTVVQNNVDGPASGVAMERAEVEHLIYHALAGEGTVSVYEDAHGPRPVLVAGVELLGPDLAHDHGIHGDSHEC